MAVRPLLYGAHDELADLWEEGGEAWVWCSGYGDEVVVVGGEMCVPCRGHKVGGGAGGRHVWWTGRTCGGTSQAAAGAAVSALLEQAGCCWRSVEGGLALLRMLYPSRVTTQALCCVLGRYATGATDDRAWWQPLHTCVLK